MDSITNLSETSEEVAATSESSMVVSNNSLKVTNQMKSVLDDILVVSYKMKELL